MVALRSLRSKSKEARSRPAAAGDLACDLGERTVPLVLSALTRNHHPRQSAGSLRAISLCPRPHAIGKRADSWVAGYQHAELNGSCRSHGMYDAALVRADVQLHAEMPVRPLRVCLFSGLHHQYDRAQVLTKHTARSSSNFPSGEPLIEA